MGGLNIGDFWIKSPIATESKFTPVLAYISSYTVVCYAHSTMVFKYPDFFTQAIH